MPSTSQERLIRLFALVLLFTAVLAACSRTSQGPQPVASYEFTQLSVDEPVGFQLEDSSEPVLLVRVEGIETTFETSLLNEDGTPLSTARLPYLRVGPVFHIIEFPPDEGSLTVSIRPTHLTRNSLIKVRVYALPASTGQDISRIEAYRNYARAIESTDDESYEVWTDRVRLLREAAAGFERSNESEARLWANFLEAYFNYFPLADFGNAIDQAREIQKRARGAGLTRVELMAMQLEGQVLIERDVNDPLELAKGKQNQAQQVLQSAAVLADTAGMPYEQAWAINTSGIGFFYQDRYAEAERQYRSALDIALDIEDAYLQNLILGNLALVRERQGDLGGALGELHVANQQLQLSGSKTALAHNWSELSRLYHRLYFFPQSVDAQGRALEIWRELDSAEGIGRSLSSLAHAYLGMGNAGMALSVMREAIGYMEQANYGRGLREGYEVLANIHQANGSVEPMLAARSRQETFLTSVSHRAHFQYEKGLDILAQYPNDPAKALDLFASAGQLALESGNPGLQIRSWLQSCVNSDNPADQHCTDPEMHEMLEEWLVGAPPREEFEARFLQARAMVKLDRKDDALNILDQLVDSIQLYRSTLPGVLGAWYWDSRSQIFRLYMGLNLDHSRDDERGGRSLLALNRLLNTPVPLDEFALTDEAGEPRVDNKLRELLATLETAEIESVVKIRQDIDSELMSINAIEQQGVSMNRQQLADLLGRIPRDSALLAYYFSDRGAWAWTADSSGVQMSQLSDSDDVANALERARSGLRTVGYLNRARELQTLGEMLLAPFDASLPATVYLLTVGELAGFPFEAIRRDDRFFGQDHEVINLLSLEGLSQAIRTQNGAVGWQRILLAGDPQGDEAELPRSAEEIGNIAELFRGMEITRLTGDRLGPDLLQDPRYAKADLFHFSGHGQINLEYPELSRLILSGNDIDGAGSYLTPLQIGRVPLNAELVVLSACETSGVNAFSFDRNLGYVTEFLRAGAGAVVASLWPVSDAFAQEFMQDFYTSLIQGASTPRALAAAKRRHLAREKPAANLEWSSFQVYFR